MVIDSIKILESFSDLIYFQIYIFLSSLLYFVPFYDRILLSIFLRILSTRRITFHTRILTHLWGFLYFSPSILFPPCFLNFYKNSDYHKILLTELVLSCYFCNLCLKSQNLTKIKLFYTSKRIHLKNVYTSKIPKFKINFKIIKIYFFFLIFKQQPT